jgi:hypothetical protein
VRPVSPEELQRIGEALAAGRHQSPPAPSAPPVILHQEPSIVDNGKIVLAAPGVPGGGAAGLDAESAGGAFAETGSASTDSLTMPDIKAPSSAAGLKGDMDIVYLPDLDEQYVIKSCNVMAKNAFGLAFKNGSELVEVQGEHDSTTLALSLLQQIENAIGTAQGVEQARIQREAKQLQAQQQRPSGGRMDLGDAARARAEKQQPIWQMVHRTWIKPGVYRLNKPWEVKGGPEVQAVGCGLLARLGLPTVTDVDFRPVAAITPNK